eukprot:COSAG06_NODE_540_length_14473_cov_34.614164_1_plen_266_part_00
MNHWKASAATSGPRGCWPEVCRRCCIHATAGSSGSGSTTWLLDVASATGERGQTKHRGLRCASAARCTSSTATDTTVASSMCCSHLFRSASLATSASSATMRAARSSSVSMSERRRRGELQVHREGVRRQAFRRERLRDQLDDMPRSPGSSDSDQDEHRYQARLLNSKDVAAFRAGQRDASLESEAGQRTPRSSSKRKTDSPHNSQATVASGKSPSVQLHTAGAIRRIDRSCTVRLCQLHSQTLKPSFLRPPHTAAQIDSRRCEV